MDLSWLLNETEDMDLAWLLNDTEEFWPTTQFAQTAKSMRTHAPISARTFPASSLFDDSCELRLSADLAITDLLSPKLRDSVSARKLSPWAIAAITGGAVVVTAAGVIVGYLVFKSGGVNLVFIQSEQ
jgi:hypothetical protein